ncbi:MAG: efflux RND transporter periplasmic adaptor subunit, partial [Planctomycetia bacterium]
MGTASLTHRPADGVHPADPPAAAARPVVHQPPRGPSLWSRLATLAVVAAAFTGGWYFGVGSVDEREALPPETADVRPVDAVVVTTAPVSRRSIQRAVEAVGTLHGYEEVTLSAKMNGNVSKIHHQVASRVAPGDVLLEIDPTDYELSLRQSEAALQVELAKLGLQRPPGPEFDLKKIPAVVQTQVKRDRTASKLERTRKLTATRAASTEELDDAVSDNQIAEAEYADRVLEAQSSLATIQSKLAEQAVLRRHLHDASIRAPTPSVKVPGADGVTYVVTKRSIADGTFLQPGDEVFRLAIDGTLKLLAP